MLIGILTEFFIMGTHAKRMGLWKLPDKLCWSCGNKKEEETVIHNTPALHMLGSMSEKEGIPHYLLL